MLMVDEVSMQSLEFFDIWDVHLNQAKDAAPDAFFGDMDVVFFGDFAQFPTLGGHSLYTFAKIFDDESLSMAARVKAIERKVKATKKKSRTEIATEIVRAIQKCRSVQESPSTRVETQLPDLARCSGTGSSRTSWSSTGRSVPATSGTKCWSANGTPTSSCRPSSARR